MFKRYEKYQVSANKPVRIIIGIVIAFVLICVSINTWYSKSVYTDKKDTNVYLNEEVCYAGGIYIKANAISVSTVEEQDNTTDGDGDALSRYTLNLGLSVERRGGNIWTNTVKIKSQYFSLKSVNLKAKSKMAVFFESLAKETLSATIGLVVSGSVNVIEETINYISEYTTESIENASNNSVDFKPIKAAKNQFPPFKPEKGHEPYTISLSFPIKQEYLESSNLIVLSIDQLTHFEQRVFLTTRPSGELV